MANTTYEVTLATDGVHTVRVTSDEPAAMKLAVTWAKATHLALVERAGKGTMPAAVDAPVCAVHEIPMVQQQGKYGPFWSCHDRVGVGVGVGVGGVGVGPGSGFGSIGAATAANRSGRRARVRRRGFLVASSVCKLMRAPPDCSGSGLQVGARLLARVCCETNDSPMAGRCLS